MDKPPDPSAAANDGFKEVWPRPANERVPDPTREYRPGIDSDNEDELILSGVALEGAELSVPTKLGKYVIQGQIGRGGMGVVWKGFDPDLRRTVAIKVLSPHLAQSQVARRRFQREARAAAAINHENVLTIHSVEEQGETPFLVMEYVSGQSLKEYVAEKRKLNSLEVIRLGAQISQGLAAAHVQGVIHRDVKLANVMLHEGATRVRLMDFGLARVAFDNSDLTSHDHTVGTPAYMAPEQIRGNEIDARADLFSLGCVLYCMLTGHSPFHGRTHAETIHKIMELIPPRLQDVDPSIPAVLSEIVEKLLMKNPDDRYQSAFEVAETLCRLQVLINQAPSAELQTVLDKHRETLLAKGPPIETAPPSTQQPNRVTTRYAAAAIVLIAGLAGWKLWPGAQKNTSIGEGPGSTAAVAGASVGTDTERPAIEKLTRIVVGTGPEATCPTLREAISRAAGNCTITVLGSSPIVESITIAGSELSGLTIKAASRATWQSSIAEGKDAHALLITDTSRVTIEGFDFEVLSATARAVQLTGTVGDVSLTDCGFRHTLASHKLSLVNLGAARQSPQASVVIQRCRFIGAEGTGYSLGVDSKGEVGPTVVCEDCYFESPGKHLYVARSCPRFRLNGSIFVGGQNGLLLNFSPWTGDESFEIVNNTFLGTRFWLSWMESIPESSSPSGAGKSRVCNNLILGGERTQGNNEQWNAILAAWTFECNWWERDASTTATADRGGRLATLHDALNVPVRTDSLNPDFLVPSPESPLLTSGAAGDLPSYIGARGPRR